MPKHTDKSKISVKDEIECLASDSLRNYYLVYLAKEGAGCKAIKLRIGNAAMMREVPVTHATKTAGRTTVSYIMEGNKGRLRMSTGAGKFEGSVSYAGQTRSLGRII